MYRIIEKCTSENRIAISFIKIEGCLTKIMKNVTQKYEDH